MPNPLRSRIWVLSPIAILLFLAATVLTNDPVRTEGENVAFGDGTVSTYAVLDADGMPSVIGVQFDARGLESPPEGMSDQNHCFDRNEDGSVDKPGECLMSHEFVVPMPDELQGRDDIPFGWVLLGWNPAGHIPPGVYDSPHFDIHFMIESEESIFSIADGPCGPEFVQCDQFEIAMKPVPSNYLPSDFQNVEAVVPAMGNHLIDVTGPEFNGEPFTRSWIYGSYDGRVIFYEEMATVKHIMDKPNTCHPIKSPDGVAISGYYPTSSCIRYDEERERYTVSMEDFAYREAVEPVMESEEE